MGETAIAWATHTENWLAGCTKVSPACTHCYAERTSARFAANPVAPDRYRGVGERHPNDRVLLPPIARGRWTGQVTYDPQALARVFDGLRNARRQRRVFANSMSDTFHAGAPPDSLRDLAREIRNVQHDTPHRLLLLTKRPDALLAWQRAYFPAGLPSWVWPGVTVEDQERADERIPVLLQVDVQPGGVRWLSMEPLLGPVELGAFVEPEVDLAEQGWELVDGLWWPPKGGSTDPTGGGPAEHRMAVRRIGWVIVGCESSGRSVPGLGKLAGPRHTGPDWILALQAQCADAEVPFFVKQVADGVGAPIAHDGRLPLGPCLACHGTGLFGPSAPDSACRAPGCDHGRLWTAPCRQVPS